MKKNTEKASDFLRFEIMVNFEIYSVSKKVIDGDQETFYDKIF